MEQYSPPKKNPLTALALLEMGVFEIGFVAVVLFLLFGILNYFNILSISDTFPKYLSWLPRQTVQKPIENTSTNNSNHILLPPPPPSYQPPPPPTHPTPTPTPTPLDTL